MLIDWFTVLAQIVNFLILVWLLKRFLYHPILNAIDVREKRIAKELADADAKKAEALKEREEFQRKNKEFEQQRATLFSQATEEAKVERQRLMDEARQAADALSAKRQEILRNEVHNLNQAISRRTRQEVFSIARKALVDLAGTSMDERMIGVFARRLLEMDEKAKKEFGESLKTASEPALVRCAVELPEAQRAAFQKTLNEAFSAEIKIRFETDPEKVSGIELISNGHKLAWSIADYLASLEKGVDELLKEQEKIEAQVQAKAQDKAPSELTLRIGKRAYELYEEHGHKEGSAAQDWEAAEREIRKDISGPAKTTAKPKSHEINTESNKIEPKQTEHEKAKPEKAESKTKPQAKTDSDSKAKPETKVAPAPEAKVDTDLEDTAEPKAEVEPEVKAKPEAKPEAKSGADVEVKPEKKVVPESSTKAVAEPEKSKPEAKSP